jgi:hypothetical protein
VLFEASESLRLGRAAFPECAPRDGPPAGPFSACRLAPAATLTAPSWFEHELFGLNLRDADGDAYITLCDDLTGNPRRWEPHQMLGHPSVAYEWARAKCEAEHRGWPEQQLWQFLEGSGAPDGVSRVEFDAAALQWRLLLQVASDDDAGMMWSDAGLLYFYIRAEDLAAGEFARCRLRIEVG